MSDWSLPQHHFIIGEVDSTMSTESYEAKDTMDNSTGAPKYLFKIISIDQWQRSEGTDKLVLGDMDDKFIHLATAADVNKIIDKFWEGHARVIVVKLESKKLVGDLRYEANPGGINKYYHLYGGKLPMDAVINVEMVERAGQSG